MSIIADWTGKWACKRKQACIFYKQTTSTNTQAKQHFNPKKQSQLFIAEHQTKGRGQRDKLGGVKKWINSDMMLSWSYPLSFAPQPIITKMMGEALYIALNTIWPGELFRIKNPNDIYIKDKKVAGLLVEAVHIGTQHQIIIGGGMNVFSHPLPDPVNSKTVTPQPNPFTHLQEHIPYQALTEEIWHSFLDEWKKQIETCLFHK